MEFNMSIHMSCAVIRLPSHPYPNKSMAYFPSNDGRFPVERKLLGRAKDPSTLLDM
jgi:hypothetical protein